MMDGCTGIPEQVRVIADHLHMANTLCLQLRDQLGDIELSVHRLSARHGHRVVDENLVGKAGTAGHCLTDGQQPGMKVGPVTQIHENVPLVGEGRLTGPVDPLAAHLGEGGG